MTGYAAPAPDNCNVELIWALLQPLRLPRYQRLAPDEARIGKLEAKWNIIKANTITLSYRDGLLWIVDGQTRVIVARRRGLDRLPAEVVHGLIESEEAELFLALNRDRRHVSALSRHAAEAIAGEERAIMIDLVLEQNGLIAATKSENGLKALQPIGAVERTFDEGGAELVDRVLQLLAKGLAQDSGRFRGELIDGLGFFLAHDPWDATDEKVLKMMLRTPVTRYEELKTHWRSISTPKSGKGGSPVYMGHAFATIVYGYKRGAVWQPLKATK